MRTPKYMNMDMPLIREDFFLVDFTFSYITTLNLRETMMKMTPKSRKFLLTYIVALINIPGLQ